MKIKLPSPTTQEIESELFNSIWKIIKSWDIQVPEYYDGYMGANGSHVKLIIDGLASTLRDIKIDNIIT